jgi:hypothetical protein
VAVSSLTYVQYDTTCMCDTYRVRVLKSKQKASQLFRSSSVTYWCTTVHTLFTSRYSY